MWPMRPKKKRLQESTHTQLTILRTHMAGQAGDLSTMRLQLGLLTDHIDSRLRELDDRFASIHREVTRIGLYHPGPGIPKVDE